MDKSSPPARGALSFPQELVDAVIDHLYDDTDALRQCSVVCRAWEPSSTLHLFNSFSWPAYSTYWLFYKSESGKNCKCPKHVTVATFIGCEELLSSSARLRNAICHLRLMGSRSRHAQHSSSVESERMPYSFLYALPELLPSLQTLQIYDLVLEMTGEVLRNSPVTLPLRELKLQSFYFVSDVQTFFPILSFFQRVSRVIIDYPFEFADDNVGTALSHGRRCSIDTLELHETLHIGPIMPRLREQVNVETVREVVLWGPVTEQLCSLLVDAATLESLSYMVDDGAPVPVELAKSPSLREVNIIGFLTCTNAPDFHTEWDLILHNVGALTARGLQKLGLTLLLNDAVHDWDGKNSPACDVFSSALREHLLGLDWCTLRAVLKRYTGLQQLRITVRVDELYNYWGFVPGYLHCSVAVVEEVARQSLDDAVVRILEVVKEHLTRESHSG